MRRPSGTPSELAVLADPNAELLDKISKQMRLVQSKQESDA